MLKETNNKLINSIMQTKLLLLTLLIVGGTNILCQSPPVFPNKYSLVFEEKASIGPFSGTTKGKIYLDADGNRQVITRENGAHDRYCTSVHKLVHTPCNHYVVSGTKV